MLPNEKALIYGKEMKTEHIRLKRAIPIGLIFSGVSAIGGLLIKGFNAISNYKKSKAMARAMKELYKAQEIDHEKIRTSHVIISQGHQNCICTHRRQVGNVGCQDREHHVKPKTVHGRNHLTVQIHMAGHCIQQTGNKTAFQWSSHL